MKVMFGIILSMIACCSWAFAQASPSSPWIPLGVTGKEKIHDLVSTADQIYSLTDQKRVLRLEQNEKSWTPIGKGLEIFPQPKVTNLSIYQNELYAFAVSSNYKDGDVFKLKNDSWERLATPIKNPEFVEKIIVTSEGILVQKAGDSGDPSTKLSKINGTWKEQKLPGLQWLKLVAGKIHPIYGLSGLIHFLDSNHQWKSLGSDGWPNTEATDVIEVGPTIYAANTLSPVGGLLILRSGEKKWTRTSSYEGCSFHNDLIRANDTIYTKGGCKMDNQDKEILKIFSYSTTRDQWREITSPGPNPEIGSLLVKGTFLYAATEDGGFFKLAI